MPRFIHTEAEQEALLKYLIGHDRIPEGAPVVPGATKPQETTAAQRTETLLAGHTLVGGGGFSCVACHRFGKFEPRNVALGTRGSDLMQIGQRMRHEYFLRWTRSPLRIVRDMEMPSFDKPIAGVLGGDIDRQLQALWEGVNDPDFTVPADPSVIEQLMRVAASAPARVVRDVFWLSDGGRDRYVPRAFAVGFGNQQNVLFDLDSMSLREWWVGDFATQRTQGKSWYWQPGGVRLVEGLGELPDFVLKAPAGQRFLSPHFERGTCGQLQGYAPSGKGIRIRYLIEFQMDDVVTPIHISETWTPLEATADKPKGWKRAIEGRGMRDGYSLHLCWPELKNHVGVASVACAAESGAATVGLKDGKSGRYVPFSMGENRAQQIELEYRDTAQAPPVALPVRPVEVARAEALNVLPGYGARRLPLDKSIMPTAIAWRKDGTLVFTSLKGHVYLARDTDGDGIEDSLSVFEEGLAAPYGVLADGDDVLVSHKPELLRLRDTDGDGRADVREVVATGWGYSDNYHDWTCGIVRDSRGNLYVGLGSDYTQPKRPKETTLWRGTVLQIAPAGKITPIGHALRYPTGLAIREDDEIFVSDNQGVQNTFNEINHLRLGAHYGVPSVGDEPHTGPAELPAIQVPHPWTRSVNGLVFLPQSGPNAPKFGPFAGHGIGCEYDSRFLMRFTLQRVGETFQGAAYPFSTPTPANGVGFDGTLCAGVSPQGDLYVGCIHDSGWLGGLNVGNIVRLRPKGEVPAGIREIEADASGFRVTFTQPVDRERAADPAAYTLSAYTRVWEGAYATPDSQRHRADIAKVHVADDRLSVHLDVERLRAGFVYELTVGRIGPDPNVPLWPMVGHYTLNRIPAAGTSQPR
jgi:glucose/arabinose dehydrogenase